MHQFIYNFHAVGQGLFASGVIRRNKDVNKTIFNWVYDCGTASGESLVDDALIAVETDVARQRRLNLVTVSHFDRDHISGLCRLAEKFKIDTLMLPYMAQEQRLWMAFEEGVPPGDDLMEFFVNPTAYLTGRDWPGIRNILYVPPSGGEGPPAQTAELPNDVGPGEEDWQMRTDADKPDGDHDPAKESGNPNTQVIFLKPRGTLQLGAYWEFVPYNDDPAKPIPAAFRSQVRAARNKLIRNVSLAEREAALEALKTIYKKQFGKESEERNIISLFLHAGPVYSAWKTVAISYCTQSGQPDWHWRGYASLPDGISASASKSSLLYTGDGYLDNHERLARLTGFLGKDRVERTGVMQVMHHGSETNWHKSVAQVFKPLFSIFSSDPNRKKWGHPHAAVLRDFWSFGPVQADKSKSVSVDGMMELR